MNILVRPSYARSLKTFSNQDLTDIKSAVAQLPELIGAPHIHSGLSLRKLRPSIFEIRAGLRIRVVFAREAGDIVLAFAGNHNQVRAWLKENA